MNTTNPPTGVLKPRTLNSTSSNLQAGPNSSAPENTSNAATTARGKRAYSSDNNVLPTAGSLNLKKSSLPVKISCLCAPTKHAGSFRCRLHRVTQKHWGGQPVINLTSTSNASSSSSLLQTASENNHASGIGPISLRSKLALPAPPPGSMSRAGASRPSRLRMVVVAGPPTEDEVSTADDSAPPVLSEGSVKYIKVTSTSAVTSNVTAMEAGALALRIMKNST